MKLIDSDHQPFIVGFPKAYREWWDLGNNYELTISIGENSCSLWIEDPEKKDITLKVAEYLGVDTDMENIRLGKKETDLYLSMCIGSIPLVYKKPKNYKELLYKIEAIVNKYFKGKN